jgi:hypothetical protein
MRCGAAALGGRAVVQPGVPAPTAGVVPLPGPRFYTLAEAAQMLRYSSDTVMRRVTPRDAEPMLGGEACVGHSASASACPPPPQSEDGFVPGSQPPWRTGGPEVSPAKAPEEEER